MGVTGDNQVNALHCLGQLLVLGQALFLVGPAVGQADNKVRPLLPQGFHTPLGGLGRILQGKAGGGGHGVGLRPHQAEDSIGDAAPLQKQSLLHPVGRHGPLNVQLVQIVPGGLVVGHQQGGQRIAAEGGGLKHPGKAGSLVIKLMVPGSNRIVPHGAHRPQLGGLGGIQRLNQGADGEISAVHRQSVGVLSTLALQRGHQAGIAPGLPSCAVGLGKEMGVQIVGKQNRGLPGLPRSVGRRRQNQSCKQHHSQKQAGETKR